MTEYETKMQKMLFARDKCGIDMAIDDLLGRIEYASRNAQREGDTSRQMHLQQMHAEITHAKAIIAKAVRKPQGETA
jgi:hypothetical protein